MKEGFLPDRTSTGHYPSQRPVPDPPSEESKPMSFSKAAPLLSKAHTLLIPNPSLSSFWPLCPLSNSAWNPLSPVFNPTFHPLPGPTPGPQKIPNKGPQPNGTLLSVSHHLVTTIFTISSSIFELAGHPEVKALFFSFKKNNLWSACLTSSLFTVPVEIKHNWVFSDCCIRAFSYFSFSIHCTSTQPHISFFSLKSLTVKFKINMKEWKLFLQQWKEELRKKLVHYLHSPILGNTCRTVIRSSFSETSSKDTRENPFSINKNVLKAFYKKQK